MTNDRRQPARVGRLLPAGGGPLSMILNNNNLDETNYKQFYFVEVSFYDSHSEKAIGGFLVEDRDRCLLSSMRPESQCPRNGCCRSDSCCPSREWDLLKCLSSAGA
jgi:hypothetical protein